MMHIIETPQRSDANSTYKGRVVFSYKAIGVWK